MAGVMIGVDPHKGSHTAVAISGRGAARSPAPSALGLALVHRAHVLTHSAHRVTWHEPDPRVARPGRTRPKIARRAGLP